MEVAVENLPHLSQKKQPSFPPFPNPRLEPTTAEFEKANQR